MTTLCVQAADNDLTFLNIVVNRMAKLLGSKFTGAKLTDTGSNSKARNMISNGNHDFLVLLSHGSGDYLCGGQYRNENGEVVDAERFLVRGNLGILSGKAIFCMSCNSNNLAEESLGSGAIAFVGFDQIPFNRYDPTGASKGSDVLVKHCKELIATAIRAGLERFLNGTLTLDQVIPFIRLWAAKEAISYVRRSKSVPDRREAAALFLRMGQGIKYHGPLGIKYIV